MWAGFIFGLLAFGGPDTLLFWNVPVEGKLPQLSIYSLAADSTGFLWMSTLEGIARWDGEEVRTWKTYRLPDGSERPLNNIAKLAVDRFNQVWASYDQHLLVKAPQSELFVAYRMPPFILAPNGTPWFWTRCGPLPYALAMSATACLDTAAAAPLYWTVDALGQAWWLRGDTLYCQDTTAALKPIAQWPQTQFLYADRQGQLSVQQGDQLRVFQTQPACQLTLRRTFSVRETIRGAVSDHLGRLWIATRSGGFLLSQEGTLRRFTLPFPYRTQLTRYLLSMTSDGQSRIWIGTVGGLYVWDPWRPAFRLLGRPQGLESGYVSAILRDRTGRLWVGTIGGGLFVFHLQGSDWRRLEPSFLPDEFVWALAEDPQGLVWAATDQGLFCLTRPYHLRPHATETTTPGPNTFTALLAFKDGLWAGTFTGTLYFVRNNTLEARYEAGAPIRSLLQNGDTLWIGLQNGLLRLVVDHQGQVRQAQREPLPQSPIVWSQRLDPEGHWLGTNLGLWLRSGNRWLHWDEADGLPSRTIYGLLRTNRDLWLTTNRGLVRVDLTTFPQLHFRVYTAVEGLGITEFNRGAYHIDAQGYLYAGGTHGLVWFDPKEIQPYPFAPQPVILAIWRFQNLQREIIPFNGQPIVLPPSERTVGFVFRGLFFSYPQGVRYRIILRSKKQELIELGTQNQLLLSGLRPGTYQLELQAIGPEGQQGRLFQPILFTIRPYLWETTGFRIGIFALTLALTAGLVFFVLSERYRRLTLTRQALENERRRLSRDLHDEVGVTLTSIYFLLTTTLRQALYDHTLKTRLQQAAELTRTALDQLRILLWSTNPENDRLPVVLSYLRETVRQIAETGNLQVHYDLPQQVPDLPVDAERRHHLVCITRESLRNVLQHAQATTVTFQVQLTNHTLTLKLCDNGRGFDPQTVEQRGLRYLQERAIRLNGTLQVLTQPGKGTCIEVCMPLPKSPNRVIDNA